MSMPLSGSEEGSGDSGSNSQPPSSPMASAASPMASAENDGDSANLSQSGGPQSANSMNSGETKQVKKKGGKKVVLKLKGQSAHAEELNVKVKMSTNWSKVINAYAQHAGQDSGILRLMYDGERIDPQISSTVGAVLEGEIDEDEAAEGVQIDVMIEQQGGGCSFH